MRLDYNNYPVPTNCPDCNLKLKPEVCRSAAGFYVGSNCNCGPYCRDSGYYRTSEQAEAACAEYVSFLKETE